MRSREELILHAVLLLRTVNRYDTKEKHMESMSVLSDEELMDYILHFYDPQPEREYEEEYFEPYEDPYLYTSSTNGDYSPSCPWNAPGMSIHDFI